MAEWDYCLELSKQTQLPAVPREAGEGQGQERAALAKRCVARAELEDVKTPWLKGAEWAQRVVIPVEMSSEFAWLLPAVEGPGGARAAVPARSRLPAEGRLAPSRKESLG